MKSTSEKHSLRIALLSYRSHPYCGGQGVYVRNLSHALCKLGHRVDVISGPPYPHLENGARLVWGDSAIRGDRIEYDFEADRFAAGGGGGIHIVIPPWE